MLGNFDECFGKFGDKELIKELEISNLLKIVTETSITLPEEYVEKLRKVLTYYAKDKIDRMNNQIDVHQKDVEQNIERKVR